MQHARPSSGAIRALPSTARRARPLDREQELVALVHAARAGEADAWARLVARFDRLLRHIARSYRLAPTEVDDVVQTTWLNLFEAIEQIRDPAAIGAWLATATRRAALRRIQTHMREHLTDDPQLGDRPDDEHQPDAPLLALERRAALANAIAGLPGRHRDLVTTLLTQPTLGYREIGELLDMPTGSIGPIRARALARLARDRHLRAVADAPLTADGAWADSSSSATPERPSDLPGSRGGRRLELVAEPVRRACR